MIEYKTGDLLAERAEALVNAVNCVGIMGRGIALEFKRVWPENFMAYAAACRRHEVQPGRMFVFENTALTDPRYISNFPTKRHWRAKSRIEDSEAGLSALVEEIRQRVSDPSGYRRSAPASVAWTGPTSARESSARSATCPT